MKKFVRTNRGAIAVFLAVLLMFPNFVALADGGTGDGIEDYTDIVEGVATEPFVITDKNGTPLLQGTDGYELEDGAKFSLSFQFNLPDTHNGAEMDYVPGDYFTFALPPALAGYANLNDITAEELKDIAGNVIGTLSVSGNSAKITISEIAAKESVDAFQVNLSGVFNVEAIENTTDKKIEVEISSTTYTFYKKITPPEPEIPPSVTTGKTGAFRYDTSGNLFIDWTITLTFANTNGEDVTLTDTYSANQTYVENSFAAVSPTPVVSVTGPGTNRTLTSTITAPVAAGPVTYTYTYSTSVNNNAFNGTGTKSFTNKASAKLPEQPVSEKTATVSFDWINKTGEVIRPDGKNPIMKWKITVKNYNKNAASLTVTDALPGGLALLTDNESYPISVTNGTVVNSTVEGTTTFTITPASGAFNDTNGYGTHVLTFYTTITDISQLQKNGTFFNNTATLDLGDYGKPSGSSGNVGLGNGIVSKSASPGTTARQYVHGEEITWTITVNQNNVAIKNLELTDTIPAGLDLKYTADNYKALLA